MNCRVWLVVLFAAVLAIACGGPLPAVSVAQAVPDVGVQEAASDGPHDDAADRSDGGTDAPDCEIDLFRRIAMANQVYEGLNVNLGERLDVPVDVQLCRRVTQDGLCSDVVLSRRCTGDARACFVDFETSGLWWWRPVLPNAGCTRFWQLSPMHSTREASNVIAPNDGASIT